MTKKDMLKTSLITGASLFGLEFFAVAVETKGSKELEIIVNPTSNLEKKIEYYDKAYNDDLVLNACSDIKIVSAWSIPAGMKMGEIKSLLEKMTFDKVVEEAKGMKF